MKDLNTLLEKFITYHIDRNDINSSYKEIQSICFDLFSNHLSEIKKIDIEANTSIFRVRKNYRDLLFNTPTELSAPPRHLTYFGRFNLIRIPLYYCSDNSSVSILESKPQEGDYITLTENILLDKLKLSVTGHCERYNSGNNSDKLNLFYTKITHLTNKKISDPIEYLHTATLGNVILSDRNYNGLMYPSIYSKGKGDNIALQVDGIDNNIAFKKARVFQVIKKHTDFHLVLKCVAKSENISIAGTFLWEKTNNCPTHEIKFDEKPLTLTE